MGMNEEDIDLVHPPYLSVRGKIICSQEDFKKYAIELEQQLQAYKDKEDKLIKWCYEHGQAIDATDILDIIDPKILNEGGKE